MDIVLPEVPLGIITLLGVLSVYASSVLNGFMKLTRWPKRISAIVVNMVFTVVAMAAYFWITKEPIPDAPTLLLVGIAANQVFYGLIGKNSAKTVENVVRDIREDKDLVRIATDSASVDPANEKHNIVPALNPNGKTLEEVGAVAVHDDGEALLDPEALEIERITNAELNMNQPVDDEEFIVDAHTHEKRARANHE